MQVEKRNTPKTTNTVLHPFLWVELLGFRSKSQVELKSILGVQPDLDPSSGAVYPPRNFVIFVVGCSFQWVER